MHSIKRPALWKKKLSYRQRQGILSGIKHWMPVTQSLPSSHLASKRLEWLTVTDPKVVQTFKTFLNGAASSKHGSLIDLYPKTYHAILTVAEDVQKGNFGPVFEGLALEEQEILFSERLIFTLLGYLQAKHPENKLELFLPYSNNALYIEWITALTPLNPLSFSDLVFFLDKKTLEFEQHWYQLTLKLFHLTEIQRLVWLQLLHAYRYALECFIYPSSSTVKLLLTDPVQPEPWRKAAQFALKLKTVGEQKESWSEIAKYIEIFGTRQHLLNLLETAPPIGQEILLTHWVDLETKQNEAAFQIQAADWTQIKSIIQTLSPEAQERLIRHLTLSLVKKGLYDLAKELKSWAPEKERAVLEAAMVEASAKQGDFEAAERFLQDLVDHDLRHEAIVFLLKAMIQSDLTAEASRLADRLPRRSERQEAARAISSVLKLWQRQRRMLRSSMSRRSVS